MARLIAQKKAREKETVQREACEPLDIVACKMEVTT